MHPFRPLSLSVLFSGVVLCCLLLAAAALPAGAEELRGDSEVVAEVVRLLQAGVSEEVIGAWLDGLGRRPESLEADQLIALTEAGASDALIQRLLAESVPAPPGAGSPPAPDPAPATPPSPAATATDPLPAPVPPAASPALEEEAPAEGQIGVSFELRYRPWREEGEDEPWDLYAYLDGELLAKVPFQGGPNPARVVRRLTPGLHRVWLTREQHEERRDGSWSHETRIAPHPILFRLEESEPARVEILFREPWGYGADQGPVSVMVIQGGEEVLSQEGISEPLGEWRQLCEDVEAELEPDERPSRNVRRALERCARWSELWAREGIASDRDEVRRTLEARDFSP